jgi:hypothetical protein
MKKIFLLIIIFQYLVLQLYAQTNVIKNNAFQADEKITYKIYYSVIGIYVNAGSATFTMSTTKLNNADVYHAVGEGSTNSKYDWIFKVRDRYETYLNVSDLQPVKFIRNVNEGKYSKHEEITFNQQTNTAVTKNGVYKVPVNVQDVISTMYYTRNINYSQYKPGDKITFNMFLDDKVYNMYISYIGKETIKTRYGKFNTIKLKPLVIKEGVFKGDEKMTIWITDDQNHIPVRIESPVSVGSIKIDLVQYENLKYAVTALY